MKSANLHELDLLHNRIAALRAHAIRRPHLAETIYQLTVELECEASAIELAERRKENALV
jgi:hypothetical protein